MFFLNFNNIPEDRSTCDLKFRARSDAAILARSRTVTAYNVHLKYKSFSALRKAISWRTPAVKRPGGGGAFEASCSARKSFTGLKALYDRSVLPVSVRGASNQTCEGILSKICKFEKLLNKILYFKTMKTVDATKKKIFFVISYY